MIRIDHLTKKFGTFTAASDISLSLARGESLYVVDAGLKELIEYNLTSGRRRTLAFDLPVGAPHGVTPKVLKAVGTLSGPMGPFAGIAAGANGTLYVSADAEGSVLALRPA